MSEIFTLVAVEVAHIQQYIFNSNRLKENIGASFLVAAATDLWARDAVRQAVTQHNLDAENQFVPKLHLEQRAELEAEVVYCGGGNFVCLFRQAADAQNFARALSARVLFDAPGLHLVIHSLQYEVGVEPLAQAVGRLLRELKRERGHQPRSTGIAGLGVTAMCDSTSLPAVTLITDQDGKRNIYSAETAAKLAVTEAANQELKRLIQLEQRFLYPLDFDHLGRTEHEKSFIAIVHADGNGLGQIVSGIAQNYNSVKQNIAYIEALRTFSENVKRASNQALTKTVEYLESALGEDGTLRYHFSGQAPLALKRSADRRWFFPFRPLIFGGDDVTFVCDGRIGIALAVEFIQQFETAVTDIMQRTLTACAGVAIVKAHYPFARAYELSEELCQSAKTFARSQQSATSTMVPSAIDWHFTTGGLYGDLEVMRQREYSAPAGQQSLILRPVLLGEQLHPYRTWPFVERSVTAFQVGEWSGSRNKAKTLAQVLRQGPDATAAYQARYLRSDKLTLPDAPLFAQNAGWYEQYCGYFDALELLDLYVPLVAAQEEQHG
ncbi:MAG: hypothetical protein IPO91_29280 [Chloroflexi bacterium]|nr:hypothetical protein [Chloroflexota bacterium]